MQTELLDESGMTCGGCVANVRRVLVAVVQVNRAEASPPAPTATVNLDEVKMSPEATYWACARWFPPSGELAYVEMELARIAYNVGR